MENLKNLIGKKIVDGVVELSDSSISKDSAISTISDTNGSDVDRYSENSNILSSNSLSFVKNSSII